MIYTFVNDYAPYTESSVNIKPYWHTKNGEVLNEIDTQLKENKRIIVSVTSEKLAS
jgi:radical SAM superfamily enzyme